MAYTINLNSPPAWNKWSLARTTVEGIFLPDAPFPEMYVPSGGFWIRGMISHTSISWLNTIDYFSAFMLSGGWTGTLAGSLGALSTLAEIFNIAFKSMTFGLTGSLGPIFGYCIGTFFKQHSYVRFNVQNAAPFLIYLGSAVEFFENSRYKRVYVIDGEVTKYSKNDGKHVLGIGILKDVNDTPPSQIKGKIKIVKKDGVEKTLDIVKTLDNWDIVVKSSQSSSNVQSGVTDANVANTSANDIGVDVGDYFVLEEPLIIEDPLLISGPWIGKESESNDNKPASGYDLIRTSHNSPYEEGKFIGVYVWKEKEIEESSEEIEESSEEIEGDSQYSMFNTNMDDKGDYEWAFYYFGNLSKCYGNSSVRYKTVFFDEPDDDGALYEYKERRVATFDDYLDVISKQKYVRMEIDKAGINNHNWYAGCLINNYIEISGNLHKILGHPEANIIDISVKSVKGVDLDIGTNEFSIVNQYAWCLNEIYTSDINGATKGFLDGVIDKVNGNKITIECDPMPYLLTVEDSRRF